MLAVLEVLSQRYETSRLQAAKSAAVRRLVKLPAAVDKRATYRDGAGASSTRRSVSWER